MAEVNKDFNYQLPQALINKQCGDFIPGTGVMVQHPLSLENVEIGISHDSLRRAAEIEGDPQELNFNELNRLLTVYRDRLMPLLVDRRTTNPLYGSSLAKAQQALMKALPNDKQCPQLQRGVNSYLNINDFPQYSITAEEVPVYDGALLTAKWAPAIAGFLGSLIVALGVAADEIIIPLVTTAVVGEVLPASFVVGGGLLTLGMGIAIVALVVAGGAYLYYANQGESNLSQLPENTSEEPMGWPSEESLNIEANNLRAALVTYCSQQYEDLVMDDSKKVCDEVLAQEYQAHYKPWVDAISKKIRTLF